MGTFQSRFRRLFSQGGNQPSEKPREYSWDKNRKLNVKDYSFNGIVGEVTGKLQGSVNGQQFTIQNCRNSTLFVLDHINTVTIDDCYHCTFILGPIKESIFIRNSKNCVCVVSSGQFRARDCINVDIYLFCPTQPIIEASMNMKFGCLQFFYNDLSDHMRSAGLRFFNNLWYDVHDFTGGEEYGESGEKHWTLLHECIPQIPLDDHTDFKSVGLSFSWETSVVPYTLPPPGNDLMIWASRSIGANSNASVVVFTGGLEDQSDTAMLFYRTLRRMYPECRLSSSKEVFMKRDHPFAKKTFSKEFSSGTIVGLRFFGDHCWEACHKVNEYICSEAPRRGEHIYLRKCSLQDLCVQDNLFRTAPPHILSLFG